MRARLKFSLVPDRLSVATSQCRWSVSKDLCLSAKLKFSPPPVSFSKRIKISHLWSFRIFLDVQNTNDVERVRNLFIQIFTRPVYYFTVKLERCNFAYRILERAVRAERRGAGGHRERRFLSHLLRVPRDEGRLVRAGAHLLPQGGWRRPSARSRAGAQCLRPGWTRAPQAQAEDATRVAGRHQGPRIHLQNLEMGQW